MSDGVRRKGTKKGGAVPPFVSFLRMAVEDRHPDYRLELVAEAEGNL